MADDMKRFNRRWLVVVAVLYLALVWGLTWGLTSWDLWSPPYQDGPFWQYGGVLLASTTSAIILASLWINEWSKRGTPSARNSSIALSVLIFSLSPLIYFLPNIEIRKELTDMKIPHDVIRIQTKSELEQNYSKWQFSPEQKKAIKDCRENRLADYFSEYFIENTNMIKLIEEEHKKAVAEIDMRSKSDDFWFNNKFIMVGALFVAFITFFSPLFNPSIRKERQGLELETHISDMFKTPVPSSILGMTCVVSLAIDLHVRNNMMVTQQLGLWIRDFVECLLTPGNAYIGWERFLRIKVDIEGRHMEGMHMLVLFDMLDAAHFYFTSIILYILYISCLVFYFHVYDCPLRKYSMYAIFLIFVLVHFTFLLFAIGGNTFPSILNVETIFWPGRKFFGDTGAVIPSMICLLISYLAAMRLSTLYYASYIEKRTLTREPPWLPSQGLGLK